MKNITNFIITSHRTDYYGPPQELEGFLAYRRFIRVYHISAPFHYNLCEKKIKISTYDTNLNFRKESFIPDIPGSEFIKYVYHFIVVSSTVLISALYLKRKGKLLLVGTNCFDLLAGIIFRKLGIIDHTIFYAIDYTKKRFKNLFFNYSYQGLYRFCCRFSDILWNPGSDKFRKALVNLGAKEKKIIDVPIGYRKFNTDYSKTTRHHTLAYGGHLVKSTGVDIVIHSIAKIHNDISDFKFVIVGDGPERNKIQNLIEKLDLKDKVEILGYRHGVEFHKALLGADVGIALYIRDMMDLHNFSERPSKINDYLICGLPIITTPVIKMSNEINRLPCGIIVNETVEEISSAIKRLMDDDDFYKLCRMNTQRLLKGYGWHEIFREAFNKSLGINFEASLI